MESQLKIQYGMLPQYLGDKPESASKLLNVDQLNEFMAVIENIQRLLSEIELESVSASTIAY